MKKARHDPAKGIATERLQAGPISFLIMHFYRGYYGAFNIAYHIIVAFVHCLLPRAAAGVFGDRKIGWNQPASFEADLLRRPDGPLVRHSGFTAVWVLAGI
jgi:hypothetical protein